MSRGWSFKGEVKVYVTTKTEAEAELEVQVDAHYDPGCTWRLPENCTPPESGCDIGDVWLVRGKRRRKLPDGVVCGLCERSDFLELVDEAIKDIDREPDWDAIADARREQEMEGKRRSMDRAVAEAQLEAVISSWMGTDAADQYGLFEWSVFLVMEEFKDEDLPGLYDRTRGGTRKVVPNRDIGNLMSLCHQGKRP